VLILDAEFFPDKRIVISNHLIQCFNDIIFNTHKHFCVGKVKTLKNYYGMTQEFLKIFFFFFCFIFPDLNLIVVDEFLLWYGTAPNEPIVYV